MVQSRALQAPKTPTLIDWRKKKFLWLIWRSVADKPVKNVSVSELAIISLTANASSIPFNLK